MVTPDPVLTFIVLSGTMQKQIGQKGEDQTLRALLIGVLQCAMNKLRRERERERERGGGRIKGHVQHFKAMFAYFMINQTGYNASNDEAELTGTGRVKVEVRTIARRFKLKRSPVRTSSIQVVVRTTPKTLEGGIVFVEG